MKKIRVLFVCLGNICRSPTAEAVFKKMIEDEGIDEHFEIDSAGTAAYHIGEYPDARSQRYGKARGYQFTTCARQFDREDFEMFDYILVMDRSNHRNVLKLDSEGKYQEKVRLFAEFCEQHQVSEVPDPYYEADRSFDYVLDLVEDASRGFLKNLREKKHL